MAYTRKPRAKRVNYKKRINYNPVKRYVTTKRTFKWGRLANDVRYLKSLINTEIKYSDHFYQTNDQYYDIIAANIPAIAAVEATPPTPGYLHLVVPYVGIGEDYNERTGRSIKLKSIQFKGRVALHLPTGTNNLLSVGSIRIMIIVDHQAQMGEVTNPANIVYQTDTEGNFSLESRVNRQRNKRYSILMQKKFNMTQQRNPIVDINMYKKLDDKIKFDGINADDFMDKCFHVLAFVSGNNPVAGTIDFLTRFSGQFNSRICYVDN